MLTQRPALTRNRITISMPPQLVAALKQAALRKMETTSHYARIALRDALTRDGLLASPLKPMATKEK